MTAPDKNLLLKITRDGQPPVYKLLSTWFGGYLGNASWDLNSGIKHVEVLNDSYIVEGLSGSKYVVYKNSEGTSGTPKVSLII